MNIVEELGGLAERVKAHPMLELLEYQVQPPVSDKVVREVEKKLGFAVPDPVKSFYRQADGAKLSWRFKPRLSKPKKDQARAEFKELAAPPDIVFKLAGNINLLPLRDSLLDEEYALPTSDEVEGEFDFEGKVYSDNEFCRMLRPFDFIDDYYCMAFVTQPRVKNWKLMLLGDYWIEYDHSRVTWLEDYLKFVVATWGIRRAREKIFSEYRGDQQPPLTFDESLAAGVVPALLTGKA
jgi:hypothetical protein